MVPCPALGLLTWPGVLLFLKVAAGILTVNRTSFLSQAPLGRGANESEWFLPKNQRSLPLAAFTKEGSFLLTTETPGRGGREVSCGDGKSWARKMGRWLTEHIWKGEHLVQCGEDPEKCFSLSVLWCHCGHQL